MRVVVKLMKLMTEKQFNFFIKETYKKSMRCLSESKYLSLRFYSETGTTFILNTKTGKIGMSKCRKDEEFDAVLGVAIAWLRYCHGAEYELPIVAQRISWDDVQVDDKLWLLSMDGEYYQYTITRKYKSDMGVLGFTSVRTYDLDLVDDSGLKQEHLSGIEHRCSWMKPTTSYKEYWKVI